jgi:hypothetical protein
MSERESFVSSTKNALFDQLLSSIDKHFGGQINDFAKYQSDPVGFGEQILGERYTDDVRRLMLSVRDYPITVAKSANATGKTHAAARIAVWFFKVFSNSQVYTAAAPPEANLKNLLWGEIGSIVEKHPKLFETDNIKTLHVARGAKSFLTGVTIPLSGTAAEREAKFSGKHAEHLLFLLDEGDAISDDCYKGIESCMSGGHARLLVMFNPRAEAGAVYRMERDHKANIVELSALKHPNVITGKDEIPGAVTRETTVRRINEWCRPLVEGEKVDSECFELPNYLAGAVARSHSGRQYPPLKPGWYKIIEPAFSYMVLGQYPAQGANQLISREWIARARSRWDAYVSEHGEIPPVGAAGVMGQDVGELGTDANVSCFRYGGFVERLKAWSGVDLAVTGDRAVAEYQARNMARVNVDATGVGAGVAPHMQRAGCPAISVKVASSPTEKSELGEFHILRDQLWWSCREWLRTDAGAMLPPDEMLIEELQTPTYEVVNGRVRVVRKEIMRELLKRSPERADSLWLTFYSEFMFDGYDLS